MDLWPLQACTWALEFAQARAHTHKLKGCKTKERAYPLKAFQEIPNCRWWLTPATSALSRQEGD